METEEIKKNNTQERNEENIAEKTKIQINDYIIISDKLESSKKTLISAIESSLDNPVSIINNYYAHIRGFLSIILSTSPQTGNRTQ